MQGGGGLCHSFVGRSCCNKGKLEDAVLLYGIPSQGLWMCHHGHSKGGPQSQSTKLVCIPNHIFKCIKPCKSLLMWYWTHVKTKRLWLRNAGHWGYFLTARLLGLCFPSSQVSWQCCCIFHYDILHMQFYIKTYHFVPEAFALPRLLFAPPFFLPKTSRGLLFPFLCSFFHSSIPPLPLFLIRFGFCFFDPSYTVWSKRLAIF